MLIVSGVLILVVVLIRRNLWKTRFAKNKEQFALLRFDSSIPAEFEAAFKKAPLVAGDGTFSYKAVGSIFYAENFEFVRIARRIYLVEPTEIEVLLLPEPGNFERKLAVAVTVDSKLIGYVPAKEATEMHKYLLARSQGLKAKAKIYLGSRPEYNFVELDLAKPLRIKSGRN